jgi:hypothetical protein
VRPYEFTRQQRAGADAGEWIAGARSTATVPTQQLCARSRAMRRNIRYRAGVTPLDPPGVSQVDACRQHGTGVEPQRRSATPSSSAGRVAARCAPSDSQQTRRCAAEFAWLGRRCSSATKWSEARGPAALADSPAASVCLRTVNICSADDAGNRRALTRMGTRPPAPSGQHASLPQSRRPSHLTRSAPASPDVCSRSKVARSGTLDPTAPVATLQKSCSPA